MRSTFPLLNFSALILQVLNIGYFSPALYFIVPCFIGKLLTFDYYLTLRYNEATMYATIKAHQKYVQKQYNVLLKARLADKRPSATSEKRLRDLTDYHNQMVENFQHERSIHLRVTLFFVTLTLIVVIGTGVLLGVLQLEWVWQEGITPPLLFTVGTLTIDLILVILTLAYIRHYYRLENSVQGLYELTKKLYELNLR